jgi:Lrp/AsnC family transcriptional regulator for asnA, asnC and gidA
VCSQRVDSLDLEILKALSKNSRLSTREISRVVKKSPSLVHLRIKRLEKCGLIKNYTTLIDYTKLGYTVHALTLLQVEGAHISEVEDLLSREPNVRAVYDVTGEYDVASLACLDLLASSTVSLREYSKTPTLRGLSRV